MQTCLHSMLPPGLGAQFPQCNYIFAFSLRFSMLSPLKMLPLPLSLARSLSPHWEVAEVSLLSLYLSLAVSLSHSLSSLGGGKGLSVSVTLSLLEVVEAILQCS